MPTLSKEKLEQGIKEAYGQLHQAESIEEVYQIIDTVNQTISEYYTDISCQNGCFSCCASAVVASEEEWLSIKDQVEKSFTPEQKVQLKEKNGAIYTVMSNSREITQAIADGLQVKYVE